MEGFRRGKIVSIFQIKNLVLILDHSFLMYMLVIGIIFQRVCVHDDAVFVSLKFLGLLGRKRTF